MFSVALVGPDGAGKTTVGQQLKHALPRPVRYVYMGLNPDASNIMLPTTRIVQMLKRSRRRSRAPESQATASVSSPAPKRGLKRVAASVKSNLRQLNLIGEEWFRQALAFYYQRRGYIVVFDRHFLADHDADRDQRPQTLVWAARLRTLLRERVYPRPDLVIYLDAPAEVLFARKGEGSIELLDRRRQAYLQMQSYVKHFAVVDAVQPQDVVVDVVTKIISEFYQTTIARRTPAHSSAR